MPKQPACAAAINSSGLVPLPSPKRALKPYGVSWSVALWVVRLPLPSLPEPDHAALAWRLMLAIRCPPDCAAPGSGDGKPVADGIETRPVANVERAGSPRGFLVPLGIRTAHRLNWRSTGTAEQDYPMTQQTGTHQTGTQQTGELFSLEEATIADLHQAI